MSGHSGISGETDPTHQRCYDRPMSANITEIVVSTPLVPPGRSLRFAVRSGDRCTRYWVLKAAKTTPDVYLSQQGAGRWLHFSIHEAEEHWHYKVTDQNGVHTTNWRPARREDGLRRAMVIDFRASSLVEEVSLANPVVLWIGGAVDAGSLLVELYLVDLAWADGTATARIHPAGRDPVLAGGVRLSDGRAMVIVASDAEALTGSTTLPKQDLSPEQLAAAKGAASTGHLRMMTFQTEPDGALRVLDLQADPAIDVSRMAVDAEEHAR